MSFEATFIPDDETRGIAQRPRATGPELVKYLDGIGPTG